MSGESRAKSDLQAGSESVGARFRSENRQQPRGRFTLLKRRTGTRQVMRYSTSRADAGLFGACMYICIRQQACRCTCGPDGALSGEVSKGSELRFVPRNSDRTYVVEHNHNVFFTIRSIRSLSPWTQGTKRPCRQMYTMEVTASQKSRNTGEMRATNFSCFVNWMRIF